MSDTNEMSREQELLEEFKAGLDKDGPVVLAQRVAELEADRDRASDAVATVQAERDALLERAETAEAERDAAIARAEKADAATRKVTAQVKKATAPAKPRKLGRMSSDRLSPEVLLDEIDDADDIEVAFSDGAREVPGIAPITVTGEAWKRHAFGVMLTEPVHLEGPQGGASTRIAGYALLLDGKQVAWCERSMPLPIAPGQRVTIADDILF